MKWSCCWCTAYRRREFDAQGVLKLPLAVLPEDLCGPCRRDAIQEFGASTWAGWS